ncbi:MAG TPA: hypothetical protein VF397_11185 [Pyrinomonadaceae bacterium]
MEKFEHFLDFLGGSKLGALFIVIGIVAVFLGAIAEIGAIGKVAEKIKIDETGRRWLRYMGVIFLGLGLAIDLASYLHSQQLPNKEIIVDYLPVVIIAVVALIAGFSEVKLRTRIGELRQAEEHLVSSVEDATRHVLKGIPQIFDRAYQLIKQADKELWIISFALDFGECHSHIPSIANTYNRMAVSEAYKTNTKKRRRNMSDDVKDFAETLKSKVVSIPRVHILTLCDEDIRKNFLEPLAGRPKYKSIFVESKKNEVYGLIQQVKQKIIDRVKARDPAPNEDEEFIGRMFEVHRLPIQLFIAGIKGQDRLGCLVFMVGTEILLGATRAAENGLASDSVEDDDQEFYEPGFYTELKEVVDVYKALANALLSEAKAQCDADRRPVYDGK